MEFEADGAPVGGGWLATLAGRNIDHAPLHNSGALTAAVVQLSAISTRRFSLRLLLWIGLASDGCSPGPLPPGSVRSEQWGLTAVVPPDLYVVFAGPARAACDSAAVAADTLIVEPSGFVRGLAEPDTVQVSFTRVPFAARALASGFIVDDSTGVWRAAGICGG